MPAKTLPLTFTNVKAYQQNQTINVEWKVENEAGIKQYEIERSADGNNYVQLNETTARNNQSGSYKWIDENPVGRI